QTGTQCRSMAGTIEAIDYVKAGKIGEVKVARGLCYKPRGSIGPKGEHAPPASVDYNIWLGPAPQKPVTRNQFHYDWHWFWDYGNGDLGNQGIHQMDIARWGLGVDGLSKGVLSYGGRYGYDVLSSYNGGAAFDLDGKMTTKFNGGGDHFGNFFTAVRSRQPEYLAADIEQGHLSSALCHLGNISYRLGSEIAFAEVPDRLKDR